MAHILLVDDEQNILNALRREALQRARTTQFDLVVTDYRMPEMDGVAFLDLRLENRRLADLFQQQENATGHPG